MGIIQKTARPVYYSAYFYQLMLFLAPSHSRECRGSFDEAWSDNTTPALHLSISDALEMDSAICDGR